MKLIEEGHLLLAKFKKNSSFLSSAVRYNQDKIKSKEIEFEEVIKFLNSPNYNDLINIEDLNKLNEELNILISNEEKSLKDNNILLQKDYEALKKLHETNETNETNSKENLTDSDIYLLEQNIIYLEEENSKIYGEISNYEEGISKNVDLLRLNKQFKAYQSWNKEKEIILKENDDLESKIKTIQEQTSSFEQSINQKTLTLNELLEKNKEMEKVFFYIFQKTSKNHSNKSSIDLLEKVEDFNDNMNNLKEESIDLFESDLSHLNLSKNSFISETFIQNKNEEVKANYFNLIANDFLSEKYLNDFKKQDDKIVKFVEALAHYFEEETIDSSFNLFKFLNENKEFLNDDKKIEVIGILNQRIDIKRLLNISSNKTKTLKMLSIIDSKESKKINMPEDNLSHLKQSIHNVSGSSTLNSLKTELYPEGTYNKFISELEIIKKEFDIQEDDIDLIESNILDKVLDNTFINYDKIDALQNGVGNPFNLNNLVRTFDFSNSTFEGNKNKEVQKFLYTLKDPNFNEKFKIFRNSNIKSFVEAVSKNKLINSYEELFSIFENPEEKSTEEIYQAINILKESILNSIQNSLKSINKAEGSEFIKYNDSFQTLTKLKYKSNFDYLNNLTTLIDFSETSSNHANSLDKNNADNFHSDKISSLWINFNQNFEKNISENNDLENNLILNNNFKEELLEFEFMSNLYKNLEAAYNPEIKSEIFELFRNGKLDDNSIQGESLLVLSDILEKNSIKIPKIKMLDESIDVPLSLIRPIPYEDINDLLTQRGIKSSSINTFETILKLNRSSNISTQDLLNTFKSLKFENSLICELEELLINYNTTFSGHTFKTKSLKDLEKSSNKNISEFNISSLWEDSYNKNLSDLVLGNKAIEILKDEQYKDLKALLKYDSKFQKRFFKLIEKHSTSTEGIKNALNEVFQREEGLFKTLITEPNIRNLSEEERDKLKAQHFNYFSYNFSIKDLWDLETGKKNLKEITENSNKVLKEEEETSKEEVLNKQKESLKEDLLNIKKGTRKPNFNSNSLNSFKSTKSLVDDIDKMYIRNAMNADLSHVNSFSEKAIDKSIGFVGGMFHEALADMNQLMSEQLDSLDTGSEAVNNKIKHYQSKLMNGTLSFNDGMFNLLQTQNSDFFRANQKKADYINEKNGLNKENFEKTVNELIERIEKDPSQIKILLQNKNFKETFINNNGEIINKLNSKYNIEPSVFNKFKDKLNSSIGISFLSSSNRDRLDIINSYLNINDINKSEFKTILKNHVSYFKEAQKTSDFDKEKFMKDRGNDIFNKYQSLDENDKNEYYSLLKFKQSSDGFKDFDKYEEFYENFSKNVGLQSISSSFLLDETINTYHKQEKDLKQKGNLFKIWENYKTNSKVGSKYNIIDKKIIFEKMTQAAYNSSNFKTINLKKDLAPFMFKKHFPDEYNGSPSETSKLFETINHMIEDGSLEVTEEKINEDIMKKTQNIFKKDISFFENITNEDNIDLNLFENAIKNNKDIDSESFDLFSNIFQFYKIKTYSSLLTEKFKEEVKISQTFNKFDDCSFSMNEAIDFFHPNKVPESLMNKLKQNDSSDIYPFRILHSKEDFDLTKPFLKKLLNDRAQGKLTELEKENLLISLENPKTVDLLFNNVNDLIFVESIEKISEFSKDSEEELKLWFDSLYSIKKEYKDMSDPRNSIKNDMSVIIKRSQNFIENNLIRVFQNVYFNEMNNVHKSSLSDQDILIKKKEIFIKLIDEWRSSALELIETKGAHKAQEEIIESISFLHNSSIGKDIKDTIPEYFDLDFNENSSFKHILLSLNNSLYKENMNSALNSLAKNRNFSDFVKKEDKNEKEDFLFFEISDFLKHTLATNNPAIRIQEPEKFGEIFADILGEYLNLEDFETGKVVNLIKYDKSLGFLEIDSSTLELLPSILETEDFQKKLINKLTYSLKVPSHLIDEETFNTFKKFFSNTNQSIKIKKGEEKVFTSESFIDLIKKIEAGKKSKDSDFDYDFYSKYKFEDNSAFELLQTKDSKELAFNSNVVQIEGENLSFGGEVFYLETFLEKVILNKTLRNKYLNSFNALSMKSANKLDALVTLNNNIDNLAEHLKLFNTEAFNKLSLNKIIDNDSLHSKKDNSSIDLKDQYGYGLKYILSNLSQAWPDPSKPLKLEATPREGAEEKDKLFIELSLNKETGESIISLNYGDNINIEHLPLHKFEKKDNKKRNSKIIRKTSSGNNFNK